MKRYIYNAKIVDGTGDDSFFGGVRIDDDRITGIYRSASVLSEKKENLTEFAGANHIELTENVEAIDADGMVLCPGFIDTHSHSDLKVLSDPMLRPKLYQGITTEVLGQDGVSMAPLPQCHIDSWKKNLAGLDGIDDSLDWGYETTDNYLKLIEKAEPSINESYLLPHGNVRMEAIGLDNKAANAADIDRMCAIVEREMTSGCLGLSSGLIYMPCAYGGTKELIEMCKVVNSFGGVFVVHQRSEADDILRSMDEIIRIGTESGVPIHFSHFKVCGRQNWKYLDDMLKKLDEAKELGLKVSFDQYPYVAGSTMLGIILPPWVHDGGTQKVIERLGDEKLRARIRKDIENGLPGWDNFIDFAGVDKIYITSVVSDKNKDVIGLSLSELGEKRGIDPLDAAFDLLAEEQNAVGMVDFYGTEEHVIKLLQREEMNLCTDGLLAGKPHPRVYGSFPRVLGKYVRDEKVLSLEQGVRKLTGKAADSMHIKERGYIKENYYADLVIFDPDRINDRGTFVDPCRYPDGIKDVFVNGIRVIKNGTETGSKGGRVLRAHRKDK